MRWHLKHAKYGTKPWAVQLAALKRSDGKSHYGFHVAQGLGKSATVFNEFIDTDRADIMLVVAPISFRADWPLVAGEWGHPEVGSGAWPRDPLPFDSEKALYSTNYEAIRSSGRKQFDELIKRRRVMLVLDETTSIKSPNAQTSKAALQMAREAAMVRILNGTPIVNNALDLFMPLKCLGELNGANQFAFKAQYCVMGGFQGRQIKGIKNEEQLYRILDRVTFRALKEDWRKDLPPKVYSTVHLEMTKRQQTHYRQMYEEFYTLVGDMDVSADMVLVQMDRLRQLSSCLAMDAGRAEHFEKPMDIPKIKAFFDLLEGGATKMIAVYFYRATGDLLFSELTKRGYKPARIGGLKPEEVVREKRRFNEDPECRVLVGQEAATARGHTLIGGPGVDRCNRMCFVENSFSLMERLQIEDRTNRGEQDLECQYFDLVTSPIDQAVIDNLRRKKSFADSVDAVVKVVRDGHSH